MASSKDKRNHPVKESHKWRRQGREIAMQSIYQFSWGELSREGAIGLHWLERPASQQAKAFASMMVKGVLDNLEELDGYIKRQSHHWQFDRIPWVELAILRLSIYSFLYLPEIPPIVTIDEAIEISKLYSGEDAWRYINGMLDAVYQHISRSHGDE